VCISASDVPLAILWLPNARFWHSVWNPQNYGFFIRAEIGNSHAEWNTTAAKTKSFASRLWHKERSYSFVTVPISEILNKFADHSTLGIVSRKWAEQVGFRNSKSKPAGQTVETTTPDRRKSESD
jgi:hypothetical protein